MYKCYMIRRKREIFYTLVGSREERERHRGMVVSKNCTTTSVFSPTTTKMKKRLERRKHCTLAVVRRSQNF